MNASPLRSEDIRRGELKLIQESVTSSIVKHLVWVTRPEPKAYLLLIAVVGP